MNSPGGATLSHVVVKIQIKANFAMPWVKLGQVVNEQPNQMKELYKHQKTNRLITSCIYSRATVPSFQLSPLVDGLRIKAEGDTD